MQRVDVSEAVLLMRLKQFRRLWYFSPELHHVEMKSFNGWPTYWYDYKWQCISFWFRGHYFQAWLYQVVDLLAICHQTFWALVANGLNVGKPVRACKRKVGLKGANEHLNPVILLDAEDFKSSDWLGLLQVPGDRSSSKFPYFWDYSGDSAWFDKKITIQFDYLTSLSLIWPSLFSNDHVT